MQWLVKFDRPAKGEVLLLDLKYFIFIQSENVIVNLK